MSQQRIRYVDPATIDNPAMPVRLGAEASSMTNGGVVKRAASPLGWLGFAMAIWLVGGGLSVTPATAQDCVGTVDAPAGKVCGLAIEAPAKPAVLSTVIAAFPMRCHPSLTCAGLHRSRTHAGNSSVPLLRLAPSARKMARPTIPRTACSSTSGRRAPPSSGTSGCRSCSSSTAATSCSAPAPTLSSTAPTSPRQGTWSWSHSTTA